jgi:hypothetical protein
MNQSLTKQNTISAPIIIDYVDYQSDRNCPARMVRPKTYWETTMLVAIGKGIELDVDVNRFNGEVHDHILRTGLRNLLMDAHASATAKAYPDNYVKRSREMAENKLASLYAGIVRVQAVGGPKMPADPVAMVILRLARKAVQRERGKDLADAPKAERLALLNRLANEYAETHDAKLRPRAIKIVELESDEAEPAKPEPKAAKRKAA